MDVLSAQWLIQTYPTPNIDKQGRLDKYKTTFGVGDFIDWLSIWQNLSELKRNNQDLNTAFTMIHDSIWSWITLMWKKKQIAAWPII
jgi:hypothetical protein